MQTVRLFHWNPSEARKRLKQLRKYGYDAVYGPLSPEVLRALKHDLPDAVLIDLSRLPSQGRDIGVYIRHRKATRNVPIVFVGGKPETVNKVKQQLPDAVYTAWANVKSALCRVIAHPPKKPVTPASVLAGYSGTPLVKKLGIKPGSVVLLINAPSNFDKKLKNLPKGVVIRRRFGSINDLIIWFVKSQKVLNRNIKKMITRVGRGGLWIVWPKKSSGMRSDLSQRVVREIGLVSGLVDYKVCAVDSTWSGLKFTLRKSGRVRGG
jgi:CheY-like chemotaxis protein